MDCIFSVRRRHASATQGEATVYLNGIALISFGDTIELIKSGQQQFG